MPAPTVVTVVGARPQFVKAAALSPALREAGLRELIVHTGQHYDWAMSEAFFSGLAIPSPDVNLQVGSGPHGAQTGRMLESIEQTLIRERPRMVVVFGDTNSTVAAALAAAKLHIPVAHVEAGLRSFDRRMPEELNRILTDHLSSLLFAPTDAAVRNLEAEGIRRDVIRTGDVMFDVAERYRDAIASRAAAACAEMSVAPRTFAFATVHRAENTDDPERWSRILAAFEHIGREMPIIWAVHPRTREMVRALDLPGLRLIEPLPYLDTQALICSARVVLTDSGGLQKEAAFHQTPCVTLREGTEWVELLDAGVNVLGGATPERMRDAAVSASWPTHGVPADLYGDGRSSHVIAAAIARVVTRQNG